MASGIQLDVLVEEAIRILRGRGEKVSSRSVKTLVKHKTEDVLHAYRRLQQKKTSTKSSRKISTNNV